MSRSNVYRTRGGGRDKKGRRGWRSKLRGWTDPDRDTDGDSVDETEHEERDLSYPARSSSLRPRFFGSVRPPRCRSNSRNSFHPLSHPSFGRRKIKDHIRNHDADDIGIRYQSGREVIVYVRYSKAESDGVAAVEPLSANPQSSEGANLTVGP